MIFLDRKRAFSLLALLLMIFACKPKLDDPQKSADGSAQNSTQSSKPPAFTKPQELLPESQESAQTPEVGQVSHNRIYTFQKALLTDSEISPITTGRTLNLQYMLIPERLVDDVIADPSKYITMEKWLDERIIPAELTMAVGIDFNLLPYQIKSVDFTDIHLPILEREELERKEIKRNFGVLGFEHWRVSDADVEAFFEQKPDLKVKAGETFHLLIVFQARKSIEPGRFQHYYYPVNLDKLPYLSYTMEE